MTQTFIGTRQIRSTEKDGGGSLLLYLDATWPIDCGTKVRVTLRRIDEPQDKENRTVKVVRLLGTSKRITIDRNFGYNPEDWVVFSITPLDGENDVKDPGKYSEESDEGISEDT